MGKVIAALSGYDGALELLGIEIGFDFSVVTFCRPRVDIEGG